MEDIIGLIHWTGVTVPTISGPTSGRVLEEELEEWALQARRWTIGAGEVFHYFVIKFTNIPFFTFISFGFTFILYYVILLCCSSIYGLAYSLSVLYIFPLVSSDTPTLYPLAFLSLQYLTM